MSNPATLDSAALNAEALLRWLLDTVAEHTGTDPARIDAARPLGDFGLSSRQAVGIVADLEERLGTRLPATLLWESPTLGHLVRSLTGDAAAAPEPAPVPGSDRRRAEPIAVIGLGCRWPGADGLDAYWDLLRSGRDAVRTAPADRWNADAAPVLGGFLDDVAGFDAEHFGITPREAATMDPQQRMLLEVAWAALEHAGIAPASLRGSRTGVFTGISTHDYGHLTMAAGGVDLWTATGAAGSISANRLSYVYDLRGPSLAVDTACSSSLVAVHHAVRALREGEADLALAGGVNLMLVPGPTAAFAAAGLLAGDGRCKTFSAGADGIARAEGCGVVVLKRLSDAEYDGDRVLAVIRSSAVNSDGRSHGLAAPNPMAQQEMLREAYRGQDPSTVDYVEAHGTGTQLGDPIEARSLGAVLGAGRAPGRPLLIGSVKTNIAHAEAAAGIAGLIKVVLAMTHDVLPPQLHFTEPSPHIGFDGLGLRVVTGPTPWPRYAGRATAGVSAFGFGGTNAHVVLEQAPAAAPDPEPGGVRLTVLSARTPDRLAERAAQLADWLDSPAGRGEELADVAHTLLRRDNGAPHRAAFVAGDTAELASLLRGIGAEPRPAGVATGTVLASDGPVFVFSGHGSQWAGMGRGLLAAEPGFAAQVEKLGDRFTEHTGRSLRALLTAPEPLSLPENQLAIFGLQVALAALWESLGVRPAAVIGHSLGSAAAAVVSGALDADEGVHLVATRARLLGTIRPGGAMAAVELSPEELAAFPGLEPAADSAPRQLTVAGSTEAIGRLVLRLEAAGRSARRLPVEVAGHSAAVEPVLPALRDALAELGGRRPGVPWYDTVLTEPRERPDFDAGYWAAHLRRPVRFRQAVAAAAEDGHRAFVEVSPHPILRGSTTRTLAAEGIEDAVVTGTLRRGQDEVRALGAAAAELYCAGTRITSAEARPGARLVDVPPMPWRRERHWYTSAEVTRATAEAREAAPNREPAAEAEPEALAPADRLTGIAAAIMGLSPARLDLHVPLVELGLDSLMAQRIREAVRRELGVEPDLAAVLRGATLADLGRALGDGPPESGPAWDAADRLVLRLWAGITGTEPAGPQLRLTGTERPGPLAELLAARLSAELDTPFDPVELLEHDSLAAISDAVRAGLDAREDRGPVHALATGDATTAPLLLFHPGGSTCTAYRPLLDRLPAGLPCLGFERVAGASIEERVEQLLPLVRAACPPGPYRLAGWSFGGALAYGVAARLAEEGAEVEFVALIDTMLPLPEPDLTPQESSARRFLRFGAYVGQVYERPVRLDHDELAALPEPEQIELTMGRVAEAGLLSPGVLRHQRQSFLDTMAAERATPRPYAGRVVLYRATEPYAAGLAMEPRYSRRDPDAGWARLCPRLEIVPVAAHHLSVVDPPHVDVVARHLTGLL